MGSNNPTTPNINVPIRIERIDEYQIQEISYDGQEKCIPPLSMSENLSRLISRIDFNQPIDELREELEGNNESGLTAEAKLAQNLSGFSGWPFDSMRQKLRVALTEICVLYDVMSIAKDKKYMIFDSVQSQPSDQRPIVQLMAKKKAIAMASQMLIDGAAKLKAVACNRTLSGSSETNDADPSLPAPSPSSSLMGVTQGSLEGHLAQAEPNFYNELKEMRRSWRLKKISNNIYGDLSYFRPIGQRFLPMTRFEVIKTSASTRGPKNQALAVKLPPDLEGRACIQVSIIKNDNFLVDMTTSASGRCYEPQQERSWQEKLEMAQNVLFCKELFCNLANQAVNHTFLIPTTVTGNQIILALFPDIKLYITLVHYTPNTKCSKEFSDGMKRLQREHKPVLEHSLHQMLRDFYDNHFKRMQGREMPRDAGPAAIDKQTIFELTRQESSLDRIVQQAQHLILRHQTMEVIDSIGSNIRDPLMINHWFCLNSPTTSVIRVDIVSPNNEVLGRSHTLIYVGTRQLRVITRDSKNLVLGYEPNELRHLLIWQTCLHQFIAADKLAKLLGWYTLILNPAINVTRNEIASTACSIVICPSNCTHMISIKIGPQYGLSVDVAEFKDNQLLSESIGLANGYSDQNTNSYHNSTGSGVAGAASSSNLTGSSALNNHFHSPARDATIESMLSSVLSNSAQDKPMSRLQDMVENLRELDWDRMPGADFLSKLELLMAALS